MNASSQQVLFINPANPILSTLLQPPKHQDFFPLQRFPLLEDLVQPTDPSNSNSAENVIERRRTFTNPSSSLSNLASSLSNLDTKELSQENEVEKKGLDQKVNLSRSLSSLAPREEQNTDIGLSSKPSGGLYKNLDRDSMFNQRRPLQITKLTGLSLDKDLLNGAKQASLMENENLFCSKRWKSLELNLLVAQKLELEDARLRGHEGVIIDLR